MPGSGFEANRVSTVFLLHDTGYWENAGYLNMTHTLSSISTGPKI